MEQFAHTITAEQAGSRLDRLVASIVPDLSRSQAQRLVEDGHVRVNGRMQRSSHQPRVGETVLVELPEVSLSEVLPEAIPLAVVYEDADLCVIDKAAGMVVHPAHGHDTGTLVNALLAHVTDLQGVGGELRPGIVHRLDKDTSGLLVVAKNDLAMQSLQRQFAERTVEKTYLALVRGHMSPPEGIIEGDIGRDPRHRFTMAMVGHGGRFSRSTYRVIESLRGYDLLEVVIATGRTHQIRVHLTAVGHPVAGDRQYGPGTDELGLGRQFLHAWRLAFIHPCDGRRLSFEAPLPPELAGALERLRRLSAAS